MKRIISLMLMTVLFGGVAGGLTARYALAREQHPATVLPETRREFPLSITGSRTAAAETSWPDFTAAAESAVETVVHVQAVRQQAYRNHPHAEFIEYFFGHRAPQQPQPRTQIGSGSGVILSADGYIVTNNHVIEQAHEIQVTLYDKHTYTARLVGTDAVTDVAVLKIEADNTLPFIPLGNSDSLRLGEWVLAIGNPYNLNSTITAGIVSAKGRQMPSFDGRYKIESFIQTDAAVNPGNSGGALVNTRGELVGINTAIASPTGSFSGYSFAVPAVLVKRAVEDIIAYGSVQRAMLGIMMTDVTDAVAKQLHLHSLAGVLVTQTAAGGAAAKAGIREGDVITQINSTPVNSASMVQEQIARCRPKQQITVAVEREGKTIAFEVEL